MNRSSREVFANYLQTLPQKVKSLREQAEWALAEADSAEAVLENLDRSRLDQLKLTGDPRLDAALRLSMETGLYGGKYWLATFPTILEKLERMEREIADYRGGGLVLADLTSQSNSPLCLCLAALEVPANPVLQIMTTPGYFHDIPISVRIPARLIMAWNSNTWVRAIGDCIDLSSSAEYNITNDGFRLGMVNPRRRASSPITTTFDLTQLLHPNWGTCDVRLAGIALGQQAIAKHIDEWVAFVNKGYCMVPLRMEWYLKFLDEFLAAIQDLYQVAA